MCAVPQCYSETAQLVLIKHPQIPQHNYQFPPVQCHSRSHPEWTESHRQCYLEQA
jgi:hypothetical protein